MILWEEEEDLRAPMARRGVPLGREQQDSVNLLLQMPLTEAKSTMWSK